MIMAQRQEPAPYTGPERRSPRNTQAREAFARMAESSTFAATFRSMELGQAPVAAALGALARVNDTADSARSYVREVAGMRSIFQTFDKREFNCYAAEFLEAAGRTIPSLKEPLAKEVIAGLGKAMLNRAYSNTAHTVVDRLLREQATLAEGIRTRLQALQSVPLPVGEDTDTPTHPEHLNGRANRAREENPGWGRVLKWGSAGALGFVAAAVAAIALHSHFKQKPAEPESQKNQIIRVDAGPQDASPTRPDAKTTADVSSGSADSRKPTVLDIKPERAHAKKRPVPHATAKPAPEPIVVVDPAVEEQAQTLATLVIGASGQEEAESLFQHIGPALTPDAGQKPAQRDAGATCPEDVAIRALKKIAAGPDDTKAVRAMWHLARFAERESSQAAANAALQELGASEAVTNSPKRLDYLLIVTQPSRN
jgi:hypothetical protein